VTDVGLAVPSAVLPASRAVRRRRRAAAGAIGLFVLANAGVIVWLWYRGGNVTGVKTGAELYTSLGRITGLLGAYLALVQVLLLSRIPALERAVGFDRLTVWHRLNGKICLLLVLAHVVLTTVGYQLMDGIGLPAEIGRLLHSYPGMITATIGTVLMIVVVVTSLVIVRRRLPYEAWYAVHLTAYAAIALGWVHQIPTGNELAVDQTAADYWNSLYLAALALLVGFRLVQPAVRNARLRLRVADVVEEVPGVVTLRIEGRGVGRLRARAGQFFVWRFLTRGRWWQAHPFSLSEAPDGRTLRITVKGVGAYSRRLAELEPGTRVLVEGPFGVFTDVVRRRPRAVLIAGGIGITPVRALVEEMDGDLVLVYRALRDEDVVFGAELERLAGERSMALALVVGDHAGPGGERLLSPEHLVELVPDLRDRDVYLCGPPGMTNAIEKNLRRAGVARRDLHVERFAL
jgi:predicted ferric reductase